VLFVNTSEKARNTQESWLVAILYSFSMRLIVLPASKLRKHIVTMQKLVKMTTTSSFYAFFSPFRSKRKTEKATIFKETASHGKEVE